MPHGVRVVESSINRAEHPIQIGIFSVGDVTPDPTTGRTPSEHERIKAQVAIARKAVAVARAE